MGCVADLPPSVAVFLPPVLIVLIRLISILIQSGSTYIFGLALRISGVYSMNTFHVLLFASFQVG